MEYLGYYIAGIVLMILSLFLIGLIVRFFCEEKWK